MRYVRQGAGGYAHALRTALGREHLGSGADGELDSARGAFEAFRRGRRADLDAWPARDTAATSAAAQTRSAATRTPALVALYQDVGAGALTRLIYDPDRAPASDAPADGLRCPVVCARWQS